MGRYFYTFSEFCAIQDYIHNIINNKLSDRINRYYHYTSLASFEVMLSPWIDFCNSGEGSPFTLLFPSQMRYLNDSQEYIEGIRVFKKYCLKTANETTFENILTKTSQSIFIVCFCGRNDLLSQWKYYGKDSGVSIEFDLENSLIDCFEINDINKQTYLKEPLIKAYPYDIKYESHNKILLNTINKINNTDIDLNLSNALISFFSLCKNRTFKEEHEHRLIFLPIDDKYKTKIQYRCNGSKLIPQFKCRLYNKEFNKLPIKSVTVGPGQNQIAIFNSLIDMLEQDKENVKFFGDNEIEIMKRIASELRANTRSKMVRKASLAPTCELFICKDEDNRLAYKTSNDILIMLSNCPFRA